MPDYTILLIDYEPKSIERLRRPLENAGYRVEVAGDGVSGATRFAELQPDLTLLEAMLPKKHGFELCQELKQSAFGKNAPVLIITGVYRGRKYRFQAMHHYGADAYLEKPISDEQLVATVQQFLSRGAQPRTSGSRHDPVLEATETEIADHLDSILSDNSGSKDPDSGAKSVSPNEKGAKGASPDPSFSGAAPPKLLRFDATRSPAGGAEADDGRAREVLAGGGAEPAVALDPHERPLTTVTRGRPRSARRSRRPPSSTSRRGRLLAWIAFVFLLALGALVVAILLLD